MWEKGIILRVLEAEGLLRDDIILPDNWTKESPHKYVCIFDPFQITVYSALKALSDAFGRRFTGISRRTNSAIYSLEIHFAQFPRILYGTGIGVVGRHSRWNRVLDRVPHTYYFLHGNARNSSKKLSDGDIEKMRDSGWIYLHDQSEAKDVYGYEFKAGYWVQANPRMVYFGHGDGEEAWRALFPSRDPYETLSFSSSVCGSCGYGAVHVFETVDVVQHKMN